MIYRQRRLTRQSAATASFGFPAFHPPSALTCSLSVPVLALCAAELPRKHVHTRAHACATDAGATHTHTHTHTHAHTHVRGGKSVWTGSSRTCWGRPRPFSLARNRRLRLSTASRPCLRCTTFLRRRRRFGTCSQRLPPTSALGAIFLESALMALVSRCGALLCMYTVWCYCATGRGLSWVESRALDERTTNSSIAPPESGIRPEP